MCTVRTGDSVFACGGTPSRVPSALHQPMPWLTIRELWYDMNHLIDATIAFFTCIATATEAVPPQRGHGKQRRGGIRVLTTNWKEVTLAFDEGSKSRENLAAVTQSAYHVVGSLVLSSILSSSLFHRTATCLSAGTWLTRYAQ